MNTNSVSGIKILEEFTKVESKDMIKEVKEIVGLVIADTLKKFHITDYSKLDSSQTFLNEHAHITIQKMREKGNRNYNILIGKGLVQVLRYKTSSLIGMKWENLIILLFWLPFNPPLTPDKKTILDTVEKNVVDLK